VSFILSKNWGTINHAKLGDFPRSRLQFGERLRPHPPQLGQLVDEFLRGGFHF
jgi:hypothetical protein